MSLVGELYSKIEDGREGKNIVLTEQDGIRERTDLYWMSI